MARHKRYGACMDNSWFDLLVRDVRHTYEAVPPEGALEPWLVGTINNEMLGRPSDEVRHLALALELLVGVGALRAGNDVDATGHTYAAYWPTDLPVEMVLDTITREFEKLPEDDAVSAADYLDPSVTDELSLKIRHALRDGNAISYIYTDPDGFEKGWVRGHRGYTNFANGKSPDEFYSS